MVVQAFDTYAEARLRLRRAEDTSDLQSDYDLGRGKRKRNTKRFQESENDDEEYRHPPSPPLSMFKKARDKRMQRSKTQRLHSLQSSQQSGHNGESDAEMQRIHSPRCSGMQVPSSSGYAAASSTGVQQRPEQTGGWRAPWSESHSNRWAQADTMYSPPTNSSVPDGRFRSAPRAGSDERSYASSPGSSVANTSRPSEHEKHKLRLLQTILMRVEHQGQQLDAILQRLSSSAPQSSCTTEDVLQQPFGDIESFEIFDSKLSENDSLKTRLLHQLSGLGGTSIGSATRRMLSLLLSPKVAIKFSWLGQKGKKVFSALNVADIICRAIKKNFAEATRNDVESVIKVWLRHSGDKLKKLELKAANVQQEACAMLSDYSD
ncbi:hypothetical protein V5799_026228 [Amblyomma americanum]|uniref:DUF4806 domain-containing protein n=1 Tax=Amblyomma americanum TaxID=6943 RepID=A0AAQ4DJ65_AMBAM